MRDALACGDGDVRGDVDDPASCRHRYDDVRCCPCLVQIASHHRGWQDRQCHQYAGVSAGWVSRGWSWCRRHRRRRRRRRHLRHLHRSHTRDAARRALDDADCSRARDGGDRLRSGPDGGGSCQRLTRSPV